MLHHSTTPLLPYDLARNYGGTFVAAPRSRAVFIIGEQRSGSNLLRLMLAKAGIAAPHPPHVLTRMLPLVDTYGALSHDANWFQLIEDACELTERNPVPWNPLTRFSRSDIDRRCRERSLVAIFGALMDTYAEARGAKVWVCKSMQYARFAPELDAYFGDPKYIYLHRDGRDVALSFTKAVVGEKHPYHIASKWAQIQRHCMAERERIGAGRCFTVRYDELTQNPGLLLRRLCNFLEVDFSEEMLNFHQSNEAKSTSSKSQLWANVGKPLMRNNSQKFLRELSVDSIRIIESVAGDVLDALGYDRIHVKKGEELEFSTADLAAFDSLNDERKEFRRSEMDEEDARRRQHQLSVLAERASS